MADTVEKVPTVKPSSSSVEASISAEKTEPTTEKKKWGDDEDDDDEEEAVSELNSLSIKEEEKRDSVLEEPEDSNIKAKLGLSDRLMIGTPRTLKKWMVFDEADQMLATDGFRDDSLKIMKDIGRVNSNFQVC